MISLRVKTNISKDKMKVHDAVTFVIEQKDGKTRPNNVLNRIEKLSKWMYTNYNTKYELYRSDLYEFFRQISLEISRPIYSATDLVNSILGTGVDLYKSTTLYHIFNYAYTDENNVYHTLKFKISIIFTNAKDIRDLCFNIKEKYVNILAIARKQ